MDNHKDTTQDNADVSNTDDIDQVRQLLLGDLPAAQDKRISELQERVDRLETLVKALVSHGEASQRAWQNELDELTRGKARETSDRTISRNVTPLTPRSREAEQGSND